jgi:3-oxoacyl-[acyl-carrier protein] reductase
MTDLRFDDTTVLVTGASTGIGAAVAAGFGAAGADVWVHYNSSAEAAEDVAAGIRGAGGRGRTVQADLSVPGAAAALAAQVLEGSDGIDVLVNNAGSMVGRRRVGEATHELYQQVFQLNVGSMTEMCNAVVPSMRARGSGAVINVGSVAAVSGGGPGAALYAATKGAVTSYTRALAKEVAADGVRVNCLSPGVIGTPFHDRWTTPESMEAMVTTIPMGRAGTAQECVGAVLFLAHDGLSGYVTGQVLAVNGGQHFLG